MSTAPMEKSRKQVRYAESLKDHKTTTTSLEAQIKALKLALEAIKTEMQADPDMSADDVALVTAGMAWAKNKMDNAWGS